jgi:molybdopterin converting factor small subunit
MADSKSRSQAGLERREAEEALEAFLDQKNEAKVFALKGDWGVGKTHLVKTFLSKKQKEYYHSSVFGVSSVDDLKMQLLSNFSPAKKEERASIISRFDPRKIIKHTKEYSEPLVKIIEKAPIVAEFGGAVTSSVISIISNALINNMLKGQLVCIDDLERRPKKLQLDELLGFIESLVEDQKCKVILIYYEDKLCEDKKAERTLKEYREKVIDIEIRLAPSLDENFYIGFGDNDPDKEFIFDYLKKEMIQTNNIRVLKKIRLNLNKLRPCIKDFLPSVRHNILEEIIFISLAKFDKRFPIDLDKLLSLGDYSKILASKRDEDKNLYLSARRLGYSESTISGEIIRLVETSICDYEKFTEAAKQLNDREEQKKIGERLDEVYSLYSESFGSSEKELCNNLREFLDKYCIFLNLDELVNLEEIGQAINLDLSSYKRNWLKSRIDSSHTLSSLNYLQSLFPEFPDLMSELEQKIKSIEETMSITQVLSKSLKDRAWSEEEVNYLNGRTVEDYKKWLLERHPDQYYMVKQGLKMGEICSQTLKQAIKELAQQSKLNAMRAKKLYNIDIET